MPDHDGFISMPFSPRTAVIIGGGISGLCAGYWLQKNGFSVTVLEAEDEPGGTMKTIHQDGWLIEKGPNSALETTPLLQDLFTELDILPRRRYANEKSSKRYIVRNGILHPLPMTPFTFLRSNLWSSRGKLRLLGEPFVGRAKQEESIASFVRRRLGGEFLDYAINPFVAGVYAGDPESLSVQNAFPKLYALEKQYGGLLIGALRSRGERKKRKEIAKDRAKLFSFDDGMQSLPCALAKALGPSLHLNSAVKHIIPQKVGDRPLYSITYARDGITSSIEARHVILSTPSHATGDIIRSIDPATAQILASIYYPPVTEVFLGYKESDIHCPLDGFGFLVPEVEKRQILGCIWSSSLFPNRAPAGFAALTVFVGGARQPKLASLEDNELLQMVQRELDVLMKVRGTSVFSKIIRWNQAIPQYKVGYSKILQTIDRFEKNFRGAYICSNYRNGISVGDCVTNAKRIVETIVAAVPGE
jgi:oxygen-dependent protoporphyrinogen oxidase